MLIRITHKCPMGCSHCLVDATPEGEHMSHDVFVKAVEFIGKIGIPIAQISGGEPTEHPELIDFLEYLNSRNIHTVLLSNGVFLEDENLASEVLKWVHGVQVTNDSRFYPRPVIKVDHPKVLYEDTIRIVSPFGRALRNKLGITAKYPQCFNLRSAVRYTRSLTAAIFKLRELGKMCTPSINVDGTIAAGETPSCTTIGTVDSDFDTLTRNAYSMTCSRCGLVKQLDQRQKLAIGETSIVLA